MWKYNTYQNTWQPPPTTYVPPPPRNNTYVPPPRTPFNDPAMLHQQMKQSAEQSRLCNDKVIEQQKIDNFKYGINLTEEERIQRNKMIEDQKKIDEEQKPIVYEKQSWESIEKQKEQAYKNWISAPYNAKRFNHLSDKDKRAAYRTFIDNHEKYYQQKEKERNEKWKKDAGRSMKMTTNTWYECFYTMCSIL